MGPKEGHGAAIGDFEMMAVRLRPDYADAYFNLGALLLSKGEMEPAEAALNQALALNLIQTTLQS
jgi:Flp pilus assembly protein TadD